MALLPSVATTTVPRRGLLAAGLGLTLGCTGVLPFGGGTPLASAAGSVGGTSEFRTLYETSFETDEPQWQVPPASYDTSQAYTGRRSLSYQRSDPADYLILGHRLPAQAGRTYRVQAWVKAEGLAPGTTGGAVAVEGYTADDAWVSGGYSPQVRGGEWTMVSASYTAKPNVTEVQISLYLAKGMTGRIWFDDVTAAVLEPRSLRSELRTPSYRGWLVPGDHDEVWIHSMIGLTSEQWSDHRLRVELRDTDGQVLQSQVAQLAATVDVRWPSTVVPVGRHTISVRLESTAGQVLREEDWPIEKLSEVPKTYVDRHRRLIRNGEPFFPLGLYNSTVDASTVADLAGTAFNTVLSYGALTQARLDLLEQHDLTGIFSLKDYYFDAPARPARIVTAEDEVPAILDTVAQFRDHPALLAWYLNDEKDITLYADRMAAHKDAVVTADPNHPIYGIDYRNVGANAGDYQRTMDIFGKDSYPVYGLPDDNIGQCTERARDASTAMPRQAMWHIPQAFGWGAFAGRTGRFPTPVEFRNMTWQMITAGATGLVWYELYYMHRDPDLSFAECMDIAAAVAAEVASLVPVLLSVEDAPEVTVPAAEWLNHHVRAHDGRGHLHTVSRSRSTEQLSVTIPAAVSVSIPSEQRDLPVAPDGTITDVFAPLAVHLYEIVLASHQELRRLTEDYLSSTGAPRARGLNRAMQSLLTDAESAAAAGDAAKAEDLLAAYRTLVTRPADDLLSPDQQQTLLRLSSHLPSH